LKSRDLDSLHGNSNKFSARGNVASSSNARALFLKEL